MAILAGFVVFAGGMAIAGAGYAGAAGDQEYYALGAGLLFILAVISIISGVIDLIIGILGVFDLLRSSGKQHQKAPSIKV